MIVVLSMSLSFALLFCRCRQYRHPPPCWLLSFSLIQPPLCWLLFAALTSRRNSRTTSVVRRKPTSAMLGNNNSLLSHSLLLPSVFTFLWLVCQACAKALAWQTRHKTNDSTRTRTRFMCVHSSRALALAKLALSRSFCQYSCPRLVNTHETRALRSSSSVGEYRHRQRLALERSPTAYAHNTRRTSVPVGLPNIVRLFLRDVLFLRYWYK